MAVVALGTFREKAGSQHPACTISRHISKSPSGLAGSQLTQPWPGKGPRKRWGRKMEWGQGWTSGSRRALGERLGPPTAPLPACPWRLPVPGAERLLCPRPLHLPRLGSTLRRRQGARDTPWCRLRLRPVCLLLRPSARSRPGAHHTAPRGTPLAATHPDRPAPPRSLPAPCCPLAVSAPRAIHGRAMTQDPS